MEQGENRNRDFSFVMIKPSDHGEMWHKELEIIFILAGKGSLYLEKSTCVYQVAQGDLFLINSMQLRQLSLEEGALAIALMIAPEFVTRISPESERLYLDCKSFLHEGKRQKPFDLLRQDFAMAFRAQYKSETGNDLHLRSRIVMLLDHLFQNFQGEERQECSGTGRERLRPALEYIHRHFDENITLKELAEHTFLNSSYLSRSFQKYMGISFLTYLTQVRLIRAEELMKGEKTVTQIAYESGFSNVNSLIAAFKQYRGMTPGQYRKTIEASGLSKPQWPCMSDGGWSTVFTSLMQYAREGEQAEEKEKVKSPVKTCEVTGTVSGAKEPMIHNWKKIMNAGYARDLLDAGIQNQLRQLLSSVNFRYVRVKGLLDDDMMLCSMDAEESLRLNFTYLDQTVDFILSTGALPMLELGHMPGVLARSKNGLFHRSAYFSPPSQVKLWQELIGRLMEHMRQRYGSEELSRWIFAPWIAPDFGSFCGFTREEHFEVYKAGYEIIKAVHPNITVSGSGCTIEDDGAIDYFLTRAKIENCMPDLITVRSFSTENPGEADELKLVESAEAFSVVVSADEAYLEHRMEKISRYLKKNGIQADLMLEEWSNNVWQRDLCNDTSYKSAYLFRNILQNYKRFYGMGYFSLNDRLGEVAPAPTHFHGGFGLFNQEGIPKSAFYAMKLLGKMGDYKIAQTEGCLITVRGEQVQIFLHNYCHYDMLYRYRHTTNLSPTERYKVFQEKPPKAFHITLAGLTDGLYRIHTYSIGPGGGSTYDEWLRMGAPEKMDEEEQRYLLGHSVPVLKSETLELTGKLRRNSCLEPHEVQLITVTLIKRQEGRC